MMKRRTFLATTGAATIGTLAAPTLLRAQGAPLKVGSDRPVIGIANGKAKTAAILAAIRGRLINGLITDEAAAEAILALD